LAIECADVEAQAGGGAVGRPHVARALVQRGHCEDIGDAFERYLGRGRAGYVGKPLPALTRVTDLVHEVGGLAVAAHLGDHGTEGQIRQFLDSGLDGIEVRHPSHSEAVEARLTRIAERLGVVMTGGSDWHGDSKFGESHAALGAMNVPLEWLDRLEARRTPVRSPSPTSVEDSDE
jgi:predicted metal-dependent phosphoesterase TrpH